MPNSRKIAAQFLGFKDEDSVNKALYVLYKQDKEKRALEYAKDYEHASKLERQFKASCQFFRGIAERVMHPKKLWYKKTL